jgi:hypothetical protein
MNSLRLVFICCVLLSKPGFAQGLQVPGLTVKEAKDSFALFLGPGGRWHNIEFTKSGSVFQGWSVIGDGGVLWNFSGFAGLMAGLHYAAGDWSNLANDLGGLQTLEAKRTSLRVGLSLGPVFLGGGYCYNDLVLLSFVNGDSTISRTAWKSWSPFAQGGFRVEINKRAELRLDFNYGFGELGGIEFTEFSGQAGLYLLFK